MRRDLFAVVTMRRGHHDLGRRGLQIELCFGEVVGGVTLQLDQHDRRLALLDERNRSCRAAQCSVLLRR